MPVELTFNAPDVLSLNDQIRAYCGQLDNRIRPLTHPDNLDLDPKYTSPLVETDPVAVAQGVNIGDEPKPRRKHRKTKDLAENSEKVPAKTPDTPAEPQPEPLAEPLPWEVPETVNVEPAPTPAALTLDNEKLKSEVIATLQDMFAAGKVKTIRGVLDKFGGGAKSFPEVEASRFAEIKSALASGEFA